MRCVRLLLFCLFGILSFPLATAAVAHAQSDASSDVEARRYYTEARDAYAAGDFETAVRSFRRAYLLSPRYPLLYNIGQAELRAGRDTLALEAFEAFLRQAPADDEHRGEVEERARMLRSMGVHAASEAEAERAQQQASAGTSGQSTTTGGTEGGAAGTGATDTAQATTDQSTTGQSTTGQSTTGQSTTGQSTADQSATTSGTPTGTAGSETGSSAGSGADTGSSSGGGGNLAPWIVLGAGGAVLVVGAVLMGIASSDASRVTNPMPGTPWSSLEGTASSAQTMWGVGLALLGVGAAAAVGGLVWGLLDGGGGEQGSSRASARLRLAPGSLFVEGGF